MENLLIGLSIGLVAGLLEIALVRSYEKNTITLIAIVVHWAGVGGLMPFITFDANFWVKGLVVGLLTTLPFVIISINTSRNAAIHTAVFIPIWGISIAYLCAVFIG